ncbi:MAG: hypothetical protein U5K51_02260 [Flavobacteriaceae bacterium]|nr:hypothetical protein [Flavobacteriaceae bacterium]
MPGTKKQEKVIMMSNGLLYRNKFVEFDEESMLILRTLLKTDIIPSNEILKIVEKDQFSPAHNERIKVQKISDLNIKLRTLLGVNKEIISSVKSDVDKRIRQYKINKSYFNF